MYSGNCQHTATYTYERNSIAVTRRNFLVYKVFFKFFCSRAERLERVAFFPETYFRSVRNFVAVENNLAFYKHFFCGKNKNAAVAERRYSFGIRDTIETRLLFFINGDKSVFSYGNVTVRERNRFAVLLTRKRDNLIHVFFFHVGG